MSILSPRARIAVNSYPFNYLVIDDLFAQPLANSLSTLFHQLIGGAKQIGKVGEVGELVYEALNYTPRLSQIQSTALAALVSHELREMLASIFDLCLDENVMLGMHRHNAPSRPGWPHTDFAVVSFPNELPNYQGMRIYQEACGCNYSDDSRHRQPDSIKTSRALACLYYTANVEWNSGMGGETGIFTDLGKRLVASIPPRNNSLLVFETSPLSYHAYLGSPAMQRNSYIWWYHADPNYLLRRYRVSAEYKRRNRMDPWDRWTDSSVDKYETELV